MDYSTAYHVYEKYDPKGEAEQEFQAKTAKDKGAINTELRLRIYAKYLQSKNNEFRNKRASLVKQNGKCKDFERIIEKEIFLHNDCNFINTYPRELCFECKFYITYIKPIDSSMKEISEAIDVFYKRADNASCMR